MTEEETSGIVFPITLWDNDQREYVIMESSTPDQQPEGFTGFELVGAETDESPVIASFRLATTECTEANIIAAAKEHL